MAIVVWKHVEKTKLVHWVIFGLLPPRKRHGVHFSVTITTQSANRRIKGAPFHYCTWIHQGIARTQSPTIKNYAPESPTFGVIANVNQTVVQWKGLSLEEPPNWSRLRLCQVSMIVQRASCFNTFKIKQYNCVLLFIYPTWHQVHWLTLLLRILQFRCNVQFYSCLQLTIINGINVKSLSVPDSSTLKTTAFTVSPGGHFDFVRSHLVRHWLHHNQCQTNSERSRLHPSKTYSILEL